MKNSKQRLTIQSSSLLFCNLRLTNLMAMSSCVRWARTVSRARPLSVSGRLYPRLVKYVCEELMSAANGTTATPISRSFCSCLLWKTVTCTSQTSQGWSILHKTKQGLSIITTHTGPSACRALTSRRCCQRKGCLCSWWSWSLVCSWIPVGAGWCGSQHRVWGPWSLDWEGQHAKTWC